MYCGSKSLLTLWRIAATTGVISLLVSLTPLWALAGLITANGTGGAVPNGNASGAIFDLNIADPSLIESTGNNVTLTLFGLHHDHLVDLTITLEHVGFGAAQFSFANVLDNASFVCGASFNGNYSFNSGASQSIRSACSVNGTGFGNNNTVTIPSGTYLTTLPDDVTNSNLSSFWNGQTAAGTWRLFVSDQAISASSPANSLDPNWTWQLTIQTAAVCGDSIVEGTEQCDLGTALNGQPGVCCTNTCTFTAVNTTCRNANGLCDVAEACSGTSAQCPADAVANADTVCASATGICDPADTCDGVNKNCPVTVADAGTGCGGSDAECDALDTCNGSGGCVDNLDAAGTVCRPGVDACDMTEACTGNSTSCPVDVGIAATSGCTVNGIPNQPCQGGVSEDIILGTSGNDVIRGGAGADTLKGNAGDDLLCGEEGDDTLLGAHGADTLLGGQGSDVLKGEAGNDTLEGGSEDDTLIGGTGVDALDGGSGNDKLIGNEDADVLLGDTGNDILNGGGGNDVLDGEAGFDDLTGGPDLDTCLNGEQLTACE